MKKTKRFIKIRKNIFRIVVLVRGIYAKILNVHENIKQLKVEDLKDTTPDSPYDLLQSWLIDNFTFGVLFAIGWNCLIGWQGWFNLALVPGIAIARHIIPDAIKQIRKAIMEE